MRATSLVTLALAALIALPLAASGDKTAQQKPTVKIPEPGVPQIMTLEGNFVRAAYNNEGYVILGYKVANRSVGEEWMLLEVGMTVLDRTPDYTLKRDALSLETPDGKTTAAADGRRVSRTATPSALQNRAKVQRDSINYFPPMASQACRIGFFAELDQRAMPWDQVELSYHARLSRPALLQGAGRHHLRPALAEREVREEPRPRAIPDPDQGRREAAVEELQGHQEAGGGRVQEEGLMRAPRTLHGHAFGPNLDGHQAAALPAGEGRCFCRPCSSCAMRHVSCAVAPDRRVSTARCSRATRRQPRARRR